MMRLPFAVAVTIMAFTATVNAQGPKAGTVGATKAHVGTQSPKSGASNGHSKSARPSRVAALATP